MARSTDNPTRPDRERSLGRMDALAEEEDPVRQTRRTQQTWSGNATRQRVQRSRSPPRKLPSSKEVLPNRPAAEQSDPNFYDGLPLYPDESCATPKSDTVDRSTLQSTTVEKLNSAIPRRIAPDGSQIAFSKKEKADRENWLRLFKARQLPEQKFQDKMNRARRKKMKEDAENPQPAKEEEEQKDLSDPDDMGDPTAQSYTREMELCHPLSAKWGELHEKREKARNEAREKAKAVLGGAGPPVPREQVPTAPRVAKLAQVAPKGGVEEGGATIDHSAKALRDMGFPSASHDSSKPLSKEETEELLGDLNPP